MTSSEPPPLKRTRVDLLGGQLKIHNSLQFLLFQLLDRLAAILQQYTLPNFNTEIDYFSLVFPQRRPRQGHNNGKIFLKLLKSTSPERDQ